VSSSIRRRSGAINERVRRGGEALISEAGELFGGTRNKRGEVEARRAFIVRKGPAENLPERTLTGDARLEPFELKEAAERRVAAHLSIEL
jgi:hypothetical protein